MGLELSECVFELIVLGFVPEESAGEYVHLKIPLLSAIIIMKGVFVVGASGAGKTTLTNVLATSYRQFFGGQDVLTVNLDCANPYATSDIDICDLISLDDVMEEFELGPNGAIMFAADFLDKNVAWLFDQIEVKCREKNPTYNLLAQLKNKEKGEQLQPSMTLIFDLPGQMELYLQSDSIKNVIASLVNKFQLKTCLLELFDATYIYEVNNFVSMCLISLTTGMNIELPHIALLSKIDLLSKMPGHGMLEEYFKVTSLKQMGKDLRLAETPMLQALENLIDQSGRVSFAPCSVKMPDLLHFLIFHLEKIFGTLEGNSYANKSFSEAMAPFLKEYSNERMIANLESELFQDDETDWQAECQLLLAQKLLAQKNKQSQ